MRDVSAKQIKIELIKNATIENPITPEMLATTLTELNIDKLETNLSNLGEEGLRAFEDLIVNHAPTIRELIEKNSIKVMFNNEIEGLVLDVAGKKVDIPVKGDTDFVLYLNPNKELKFIASDNVTADYDKVEGLEISGGHNQDKVPVLTQEEVVIGVNPVDGPYPQMLNFIKVAIDSSRYINSVVTLKDSTTKSPDSRTATVRGFKGGYTNTLANDNPAYNNFIKSSRNGTWTIEFEDYMDATVTAVFASNDSIEGWDKTITLDLDTEKVITIREPEGTTNVDGLTITLIVTDK